MQNRLQKKIKFHLNIHIGLILFVNFSPIAGKSSKFSLSSFFMNFLQLVTRNTWFLDGESNVTNVDRLFGLKLQSNRWMHTLSICGKHLVWSEDRNCWEFNKKMTSTAIQIGLLVITVQLMAIAIVVGQQNQINNVSDFRIIFEILVWVSFGFETSNICWFWFCKFRFWISGWITISLHDESKIRFMWNFKTYFCVLTVCLLTILVMEIIIIDS